MVPAHAGLVPAHAGLVPATGTRPARRGRGPRTCGAGPATPRHPPTPAADAPKPPENLPTGHRRARKTKTTKGNGSVEFSVTSTGVVTGPSAHSNASVRSNGVPPRTDGQSKRPFRTGDATAGTLSAGRRVAADSFPHGLRAGHVLLRSEHRTGRRPCSRPRNPRTSDHVRGIVRGQTVKNKLSASTQCRSWGVRAGGRFGRWPRGTWG